MNNRINFFPVHVSKMIQENERWSEDHKTILECIKVFENLSYIHIEEYLLQMCLDIGIVVK